MPELGGPTTWSGIYFQDRVVVYHLARMIWESVYGSDNSITSIRVEAPELVDDVLIMKGHGRIFQSIKEELERSSAAGAPWRRMWNAVHRQRNRPDFDPKLDVIELVFPEKDALRRSVDELTRRASTAKDPTELRRRLTGPTFKLLEDLEGMLRIDDAEALVLLGAMRVRFVGDAQGLYEHIIALLASVYPDNPPAREQLIDSLIHMVLEGGRERREFAIDTLEARLETRGLRLVPVGLRRRRYNPPLVLPSFAVTERNRLHFAARWLPFAGREAELEQLKTFLESQQTFAWWAATGPAGLGKSRLALELCLSHLKSWWTGFLPEDHGFQSWHDWQPEGPTLLVVDYAASRADEVRSIIVALHDRALPLDYPVRLLLLERQAEGHWWNTLFSVGRIRYSIEHALFAPPLNMQPMPHDDIWKTVCWVFSRKGISSLPGRRDVLAAIESIDPHGRPLLVALAAEAIAEGRDIRHWDKELLLRDMLEREIRYWQLAGVTERDRNLLALATISGGLPLGTLHAFGDDTLFPLPTSYDADRYLAMSGRPAIEYLAPLEPDIIGEFFVLEHLRPRHALDIERVDQIRSAAWRASPLGTSVFALRAANDFGLHPTLPYLLAPAEENETQRLAWSLLCANLVALFGAGGQVDRARKIYQQLSALVPRYPGEVNLRHQQAASGANLIVVYGVRGDMEPCRDIYGQLMALAHQHGGDPGLRERLVVAGFNLLWAYIAAGQLESAEEMYRKLANLAAEHPAEASVREILGRAAVNLISAYGDAQMLKPARDIFSHFAAVTQVNTSEPVLRERLAAAGLNLITAHLKLGDVDGSLELYRNLHTLVMAHSTEAGLRMRLAKAAVNLVATCCQTRRRTLARQLYDELAALARQYPDEPTLGIEQAKAGVNLTASFRLGGGPDLAQEIYEHLAALAQDRPNEPAFVVEQAKAGSNLINAYAEFGRSGSARHAYAELLDLVRAHPAEGELLGIAAQALVNLVAFLGTPNHAAATQAYQGFNELARQRPHDSSLRAWSAKAAFNLIATAPVEERVAAFNIYKELVSVAYEYPGEPELRECLAKAGVALTASFGRAREPERAREIYNQVEAVTDQHPTEPILREQQAAAACNLIYAFRLTGRLKEAASMYEEITKLAHKYPDEPVVREFLNGAIKLIVGR